MTYNTNEKQSMKKTLFIKIDNTPVPKGVDNDYVTLDCKQINDFCSFVGDALCGEMKDADGTLYYKLVKPAGNLISEYKQADEESFQAIVKSWQELVAHLIQDNNLPSVLFFPFPQKYTNWLQESSNEYYCNIGNELQNRNNIVELSTVDVYDTIIFRKISKNISEELARGNFDFIVFSNPYITSKTSVVNNLSVDVNDTHFVTYSQLEDWGKLVEERRQYLNSSLTYDSFYKKNESFINQQIVSTFEEVMKGLKCIQGYSFFANFSLWKRDKIGQLFEDQDFRSTFYKYEKQLADNISNKVQNFREENEFKVFNTYEQDICRTLGVEFHPVARESFEHYYFPIDYHTAIKNFIDIIVDYYENYTHLDELLFFNSVNNIATGKSNRYFEDLNKGLLYYYRFHCLENLKESLQSIWEIYDPIVEKSNQSESSGGCYITTALCNYLAKKDDCYELTILRGFRDNWLCYQPNGKDLIKEYYRYAPSIVDKLNLAPDKDIIYGQIKKCIYTCLAYIWSNQFEKAKSTYIFMIRLLSNKFQLSNGR